MLNKSEITDAMENKTSNLSAQETWIKLFLKVIWKIKMREPLPRKKSSNYSKHDNKVMYIMILSFLSF